MLIEDIPIHIEAELTTFYSVNLFTNSKHHNKPQVCVW